MKVNWEVKQLNTKMLSVDKLYQRDVDMSLVKQMKKEFREPLVSFIKVSFRDGKYWIFDGQHTAELLKLMNGGKDCLVWCIVYYGLTWLDECELFLLQRGLARNVGMNDKFRARRNRGDRDVVDMCNIAEKLDIRIDFTGSKGDNRICALTTLNRIYNAIGPDDYCELLSIIKDAWNGEAASFSNEILKGMFVFYSTYKGQFNRKRLVTQLGTVSPTVIIREGRVSSAPGASKFARQMLAAYNRKAKNRLPDLL